MSSEKRASHVARKRKLYRTWLEFARTNGNASKSYGMAHRVMADRRRRKARRKARR